MQRLALYVAFNIVMAYIPDNAPRSRTFMRSVVSDDSPVGMLLFDEPSASLDPSAEHGEWGFCLK